MGFGADIMGTTGRSTLEMYFLFLIFWIILNGRFTLEILLFGLVISAVVYAFICRFMGYSPRKDFFLFRNLILLLTFAGVLVKEIARANLSVLKLILSPKYEPEPALIYFRTDLKYGVSRVLLANSITLTPGTITVSVVGDEFCVHCLDKEFAEGIADSDFVKLLRRMEAGR